MKSQTGWGNMPNISTLFSFRGPIGKPCFAKFSILFGFFWPIFIKHSWGYPELVRHNYVNCNSCHISPYGGGVLTQYGRELSREILSTWGTENENEARFAYGLVRLPSWLEVMGMYRNVYAYQNTPRIREGKFIFMQNDLEAAAHTDKWYFVTTIGYQNPPQASSLGDHIISRRHYVNFRPTDELSFRAGRFFPAYGLNIAEHVTPIKRDLGWDEGRESYNVEAAWIGEKWNVFLTLDLGRPDTPSVQRETGFAATQSVSISDHYKLGASYFYGNGSTTTRNTFGPWAVLGFTPHFFLLTELDFQQTSSKTNSFTSYWGAVNYQRLDYEIIQGLHFYFTQDYSRLNFGNTNTMRNSFGIGSQFFPRPHIEINLSWQKLRMRAFSQDYTDFAWFMLNYYL
jgi:hypothetical protein